MWDVHCLNCDLYDSMIYRMGRREDWKGGRRNGCLSEAGFTGYEQDFQDLDTFPNDVLCGLKPRLPVRKKKSREWEFAMDVHSERKKEGGVYHPL